MQGRLGRLRRGWRWQEAAARLFHGQVPFNNGAAMRVAPPGAYFVDELEAVMVEAEGSAVITHAHSEAATGAIAVAVAAAYGLRLRGQHGLDHPHTKRILPHGPASEIASRLRRTRDLSATTPVDGAVAVLGHGSGVSTQDAVPCALWCRAPHLAADEEALW
jgi:ADP-ribosylglycohydrolase